MLIKPIISVICAEEFRIAYIYTPFLVLAVVTSCFATFMGSIYLASKQSVRSLATAAIGAALNIIFNVILIPVLGNHGAAIATCISFMVIFIVRVKDSRKIVFMDLKPIKMITNYACLFVMGMIIIFVPNELVYYLILSVLFIFTVIINFRPCVIAIKQVLHKN